MADWSDKTVWITGASSGIGAELARQIAACGARVGLLARNEQRLESVAAAARATSDRSTIAWVSCDVRSPAQVAHAATALVRQLGSCDVLVANAGIYRQTDVATFSAAASWNLFETNVHGVLTVIEAVLPSMVERRRGHLVAVSSLAGRIGLPRAAAYCASKSAVLRLMESLRLDLQPLGIAVTTVLPGTVDTPMITEPERAHAVKLDRAARWIVRAIERRKPVCVFPQRTAWLIRLARLLPPRLFDAVMRRMPPMEEVDASGISPAAETPITPDRTISGR